MLVFVYCRNNLGKDFSLRLLLLGYLLHLIGIASRFHLASRSNRTILHLLDSLGRDLWIFVLMFELVIYQLILLFSVPSACVKVFDNIYNWPLKNSKIRRDIISNQMQEWPTRHKEEHKEILHHYFYISHIGFRCLLGRFTTWSFLLRFQEVSHQEWKHRHLGLTLTLHE